ncbi:MAG: transcriptional repressor LexA [Patescibacteria group bacterium]|nr:transcriptional repressor LexA [Patescibacteria group bacterium]MDD5715230.1 transcriptional repressor LexA [Patescibacteria group bacterium]
MVTILPKKKQEILSFLKEYITEHGYAPTLTEIARQFKVSSLATVHEHLQFLEDADLIIRDANEKRGIRIPEMERHSANQDAVMVPVVGLITAGEPIEAIENREQELPVPKELVKSKNAYILKVRGDSMIESLIADGDFVICEKTDYAKDGDTVVAMLEDGTATLKKFFRTKSFIRLQPANKQYKPRYEKNVIIQGKVMGIIRSFT